MTQTVEMERHNMADLGALLEQMGISWLHFPVQDFSTPAALGWAQVSRHLHRVLDAKGAVLAHCYGGQGRSGMVLLRLMVERGENPPTALARLREQRPGAVETDAQYRWATAPCGAAERR